MEKNSGVLANTLNRISRYKVCTLYGALTVFPFFCIYGFIALTPKWKKPIHFLCITIELFFYKDNYGTSSSSDSSQDDCLKLKGQMMFIKEWDAIIFLATPV